VDSKGIVGGHFHCVMDFIESALSGSNSSGNIVHLHGLICISILYYRLIICNIVIFCTTIHVGYVNWRNRHFRCVQLVMSFESL